MRSLAAPAFAGVTLRVGITTPGPCFQDPCACDEHRHPPCCRPGYRPALPRAGPLASVEPEALGKVLVPALSPSDSSSSSDTPPLGNELSHTCHRKRFP